MPPSPSPSEETATADLFTEPEGFFAPEKPPTFVPFDLADGTPLNLRLVGDNPLWGHYLWNGARELAAYLQEPAQQPLLHDASVLELGAGAGLPSLVSALKGARKVIVTDYPDPDLITNLKHNVHYAVKEQDLSSLVTAVGYRWGDPDPTAELQPYRSADGFRLLLLADVNFNHSEHRALVSTLTEMLSRNDPASQALVFFTPYRPWLLEKDRALFRVAAEEGFVVEKIREKQVERVMFDEDPGDESLRRTVYGYAIRWPRRGEEAGWTEEVSSKSIMSQT